MSIFQNTQKLPRENEQLLKSIFEAQMELEAAHQNFAYATDPMLVDVYAYQIKSAQAKYSYLITAARKKGLTGDRRIKHAIHMSGANL